MQIPSINPSICAIGLLFFFLACNPGTTKEKDTKSGKPDSSALTTPATGTDTTRMKTVTSARKCFFNAGLKYEVDISMNLDGNLVIGNVSSGEIESEEKESVEFEGTRSGEKLTIIFKGAAPVIGSNTEWTDKAWTLKIEGGKEMLVVPVNAKNYDTNKWEAMDYSFEPVVCK